MSVNKVILIGHLGRDPEVRTFPSGGQVANVTLATNEHWKDKATGEAKERTEWHRVVFNNRLAEIAAQYLKKGGQIYVEGRLRTREWEQNGERRFATEVAADSMKMLGGKPDGQGKPAQQSQARNAPPPDEPDDDSNIPF